MNGQLAITEVMSDPFALDQAFHGVDYLELHNFGDKEIDLESLSFADDSGILRSIRLSSMTTESSIQPHETIIFARMAAGVLSTADDFRSWWGESALPTNLKIGIGPWAFGFSNGGDLLQLWSITSTQTNLLDSVEFGSSAPGSSFEYDPSTGLLNRISKLGVHGAFRAAFPEDIGSPGINTGPVPLRLVKQSTDTLIDGGSPVTLEGVAVGLPRPRYQWHFNGHVLPGENNSTLTLTNTKPNDEGDYTVEVTNGLTRIVSAPIHLTVNTMSRCAGIVRGPSSVAATPGQSPVFSVETRGYPLPTLQWQFNGTDLPGETSNRLVVPHADESEAGLYSVVVSNALCTTNASALLTIMPRPKLAFTEIMASPSVTTNAQGVGDWWELTNLGNVSINLRGYRFNDSPGVLAGAIVIDRDIILNPGQSMVGISDISVEEFRRSWGPANLPSDLQIFTYKGNGFAQSGEMIRLWNDVATIDDDYIAAVGFSTSITGTSFWYDEAADCEFDCLSVEGERGAFRAAGSNDIGSPGWTSNEQRWALRILSIRREAGGLLLEWNTRPGMTYEVQAFGGSHPEAWSTIATRVANAGADSVVVPIQEAEAEKTYRIALIPSKP